MLTINMNYLYYEKFLLENYYTLKFLKIKERIKFLSNNKKLTLVWE
jgi:hypothetical protein